MACTIFEIFNCATGKTLGLRHGEKRAIETAERCINAGAGIFDYLPWKVEGAYVVDMRDNVKEGPFVSREKAQDYADFENMCTDVNSFRVVLHSL